MKHIDKTKTAKVGYIAVSIFFCILGLIMILFPGISAAVVEKLIGIAMIIFGIVKLIGYFSKDLYRLAFQFDLAFGILMIILGVITVTANGGTILLLCVLLGISVLSDGLFKVQIAEDSRRFGISNWWIILVFAILASVGGIVLIFRPSIGTTIIMTIFGIVLLLEGILNMLVAIYTIKITKNIHAERSTIWVQQEK